jgi:phosphoribosylanthranilate isomerase
MTVEAKICGLSTPETLDAAIAAGARFIGFVTYPRSAAPYRLQRRAEGVGCARAEKRHPHRPVRRS